MVEATVVIPKTCPRCRGAIVTSYEEPQCLQCGYVDYTCTSPVSSNGHTSILNKGTQFILRYMGDSPCLSDRLALVKVVRIRNRVTYDLDCPFCGKGMVQAPLSGHRKNVREERFKCPDGHRVSLIPSDEGVIGWK